MTEAVPLNVYEYYSGFIINEAGEQLGFKLFYEDYVEVAFRVARKHLDEDTIAEEIGSRALDEVWAKRDKYRHDGGMSLKNWVAKKAKWLALDWQKKHGGEVAFPSVLAQVTPANEPNPEQLLVKAERVSHLYENLYKCLSGQELAIIEMRYGEELSYREIAEQFSEIIMKPVSEDAARKRIARALKKMREVMHR